MSTETPENSNFLRTQIEADLASGRYQTVVTRFPPEPNGFLHIGHAKAICVDFGLAAEFGGRCHLRFDDTNPTKEDLSFARAIQEDIKWLGFDWGEHFYHASDYFQQLYDWALKLIEEGHAYVDSSTGEEIRALRGTVNEAGRHSPYRERPVAESLKLIDEMRRGLHPEGSHVVRAKGDMSHPNMKMRDPVMYRILQHDHDRTGDAWRIYPMYDYAHGLSDAIEGVTHSICTLEFQNNRALYDFFVELVGFTEPRPHQYEMARLKLPYTVVSKRSLKPLVEAGLVNGWDDPRMSSLAGLRARGIPAEAIRRFVERVGVAKANSIVDPLLLDNAVREVLNDEAPRLMAVLDPLPLRLTNWDGPTEWLDADLYPADLALTGTRSLPFGGTVLIERSDFQEEPEKGFKRLAPGREVRLRYGYLVTCTGVERDASGTIVGLVGTYDPATRGGQTPDDRKVSATLHWVDQATAGRVDVLEVGQLFLQANLDGVEDLLPLVNPDSLTTVSAWVEPAVLEVELGGRVQFERTGYYYRNPNNGGAFTRIVAMKSSWGKPAEREVPNAKKKGEPGEVGERSLTAPQRMRVARLEFLGVPREEALVLATNREPRALFEATVDRGAEPADAAKWCVHEVPKVGGEIEPTGLAALIGLVADGVVTHRIARDVLAVMGEEGGAPDTIIAERGWRALNDESALIALIDAALLNNPTEAGEWRAGKDRLEGFFVGQVIKASKGRADARRIKELLGERRES